jgi:hypothetical protein
MTRTERSAFPRALAKDRSESKTGLDKSIRKNGAGAHGWGSLSDEAELEFAALKDEQLEFGDPRHTNSRRYFYLRLVQMYLPHHFLAGPPKKLSTQRSASSLSEDEVENARQFRKIALKSDGMPCC